MFDIELTAEKKELIRQNPNFNTILRVFENMIRQYGINYIWSAGCSSEEDFVNFIDTFNKTNYCNTTKQYWRELATYKYEIEVKSKNIVLSNAPKKVLSTKECGAWSSYLQKLKNNKYSPASIDTLENATKKIVTELSKNTDVSDPIRGMVIGNVQSGKTANMAGVISMAADEGYNFFIVLSGTIDNLRKQTQTRLTEDLYVNYGMINFISLENLSPKQTCNKLQDLHLEFGDSTRYITVCLKNKRRLENLLKWICSDENQKQKLKILVIDDEADQAGINTANYSKSEKTTICRLIENLVFARAYNNKENVPYSCMNYIGYTATPYANFLNSASPKSLYPKNFIISLESSKDYIGPELIFGIPEDHNDVLNIVNYISNNEAQLMTKENIFKMVPIAFKESIMWFLLTVVLFRKWDLGSPVSMLIHTSSNEPIHNQLKDLTIRFFNELKNMTINEKIYEFNKIWDQQVNKLNRDLFLSTNIEYESKSLVNDFPAFKDIIDDVLNLVDKNLTYILLDEETEKLVYSDGIHLCIDNSYNNKVKDDKYLRIVYPDKKDKAEREKCPAFIVIGGNTLSRGLTLEGLTTSYFLRNVHQADSLMQMGRWFGYRRKYEVLPRIWMNRNDEEKFQYLTKLDNDLRNEIKNMYDLKHKPTEYAVRIDNFPEFATLKITSKNKMQGAIDADYSNHRGQTVKFYSDKQIINNNLKATYEFITTLGPVDNSIMKCYENPINKKDESKVWLGVNYKKVLNYLRKMKFPSQSSIVEDYDAMTTWFEEQYRKNQIEDWNIVLSGVSNGDTFTLGNINIGLSNRAKLDDENCDIINLKTISRQSDHFIDVDCRNINKESIEYKKLLKYENYQEFRRNHGLSRVPLLIIYIINKNSKPTRDDSPNRVDLNAYNHLVGYDIYIPSDGVSKCSKVQVDLRKYY